MLRQGEAKKGYGYSVWQGKRLSWGNEGAEAARAQRLQERRGWDAAAAAAGAAATLHCRGSRDLCLSPREQHYLTPARGSCLHAQGSVNHLQRFSNGVLF